ncbi:MAG: type II secretion system F family protein [Patescibacteria group bacterium]
MSLFIYEAADKEGKVVVGEINALNSESVASSLAQKNLTPVKIELKTEAESRSFKSKNILERFTTQDKIVLIRNLAATVKAGLSLNEALDILIADSSKKIVGTFLIDAQFNIQNGQPLSTAFENNRRYFPPLFVGLIKAGEASGRLDNSLEELSRHLTKEHELVKKVKSAMAYPLILIGASIAIVTLMLIFVLPKLTKSFEQNNLELPLLTRILMNFSSALTYSLFLDFAIVAALVGFFLYFRKTPRGKRVISYLLFHTPVVKNLVKKIILVRFARTLGTLIDSALPISESLNLTAKAVGNDRYEEAIARADKEIRSGIPLSQALRNDPELFPKFLVSLVGVGEKTGTLGQVLKNFADFYDNDVDTALKDLTTFLEPILLLFMGLMIGTIAMAILMPIYQMTGSFNY